MAAEPAGLRPRARRMGSVAMLARPVQHDVNNLLTVVFANLELLKRTAAEGPPQRQLDRIQVAARRLDSSTRAMLNLLRRPTGQVGELRLSEAVGALEPLLGLLLTAGTLDLELPEGDPMVRLDRAAFEDALLAIAQQASEGMPREGKLRIAVEAGPDEASLVLTWPEGLVLPGLPALAALGRELDGRVEEAAGLLRLSLPAEPAT
ncbi:hypothetical protein JMJ55_17735 [Belnapia sp. T6]|uniref:histidine kinase n=1 Tax=Belnapia mucosa TaxID=2804532 RepID=A0ABS1V670_9PROT|nr:histidine kinase dimerization/phospho-acceptor domain-containing protein [Belnapia mucosa]MBL6457181.1 hypothetical protein [Belnapia mucosa]